ncbi:hypothetical protein D9619_002282 [Psilocybe cf. subviscida]|uniref:Uncharacterized protein n=1 Tax=Psilocybe cf. subviscida TaxID=2480587 RepID=A0A8H5F2P4_9AGAR|nr:hypothetical protein D9619_002282 [Psilocybe cf. subviscida]
MHSEPTPPVSPSAASSLAVPIPGPYLLHGLPMQIMEKRQRSAPRPRSPLRSQILICEDEEAEVDSKQLEDSDVFAAPLPPLFSHSETASAGVSATGNASAARFDPFAAYDLECFEDLGLEDVEIAFDIQIVEQTEADNAMMATAGGAVERVDCLSGSAAAALASDPVRTLPSICCSVPSVDIILDNSKAPQRTDDAGVPVGDSAPIPSSTSASVGLGLLAPECACDLDAGVLANPNATAVLSGNARDGTEAEPTTQLMTLESSSSISCLAAPMVPPSISVTGPSGLVRRAGAGTGGSGMVPPSLSASSTAAAGPNTSSVNVSMSSGSGSLKEPPVQEMCAPTAVMSGPSPTLMRTTPPVAPSQAVEDISVLQPSAATVAAERMHAGAEIVDAIDERYIGNRMLKSSAAIEKWRHACADANMDVDTGPPVGSRDSESESAHPAVERRDDPAHADYRDEPVGRRDSVPRPRAYSISDANTITTTDTSFDIVESSSSSAPKTKESVEGLGLGLPSEVPGVVVARAASGSVSAPSFGPEERPMMSTAPGCMNLAALAREDMGLEPTSDMGSAVMMTSEVRDGTRFFTRAQVYPKRLLWSVEEEDQEDLALFDFDEDEEMRKLDETMREMKAQRERNAGGSSSFVIPRLSLGAGVGAGARALSGAWSRISGLVLSSPAGTSQYDADVEEGGDAHTGARGAAITNNSSSPRSSTSDASSSRGCSAEEQEPLITVETHAALDDIPLSSTSPPVLAPVPRKGYVSSFMSRLSLSRSSSSTSSSGPVAAMPPSPAGRKSPGFVEHVDAPRGLGLGRLGVAAVKRFQILF